MYKRHRKVNSNLYVCTNVKEKLTPIFMYVQTLKKSKLQSLCMYKRQRKVNSNLYVCTNVKEKLTPIFMHVQTSKKS